MRLFISWAGPLSRNVGILLRQFIPCMLQRVDVFMSQHDIESGARWSVRLAEELALSDFGILCLTPDNVNSAWLLFEAGALTKQLSSRACGLLLGDLSPVNVLGPLAQFQHRTFSEPELRALVADLNGMTDHPLTEQQLDGVFTKWWPDIEAGYTTAVRPENQSPGPPFIRDQRDILEELLSSVRGLERRLAGFQPGYGTTPEIRTKQYKTWNSLTDPQKRILMHLVPHEHWVSDPEPDDWKELPKLEEMGLIRSTGGGFALDADIAAFAREQANTDYSIPG